MTRWVFLVWLVVAGAAGGEGIYPRSELSRPSAGDEAWMPVPIDVEGSGEFVIPADWEGRRMHLHVEGRGRDPEPPVVNGRELSRFEGAPGRETYELADVLEGSAQALRLTGGARVWVEPVGESLIIDAFALPDAAAGTVTIHVRAELDGTALLRIGVVDDRQREVAAATLGLTYGGADSGIAQFLPAAVQLPLPNARRWSPEDPYRYALRIELKRDDEVLDSVECQFGMRDVERRGSGLALNGEAVAKLNGVVRSGAEFALSAGEITARGFDAVSQSGVADGAFYEACDRLGLLVFQELPAGDGGQMREVFARLRRHPSVIVWQPKPDIEVVHQWLKRNGPLRPTAGAKDKGGDFPVEAIGEFTEIDAREPRGVATDALEGG